MGKTTYERGETLTYPNHYPTLTFTPIFGHRGDFMWVDEVKAAWPEHDSEFAFVRSTMHDERVDMLKAENEKLRELVNDMWICVSHGTGWDCATCPLDGTRECDFEGRMITLGVEVG